MKVMFYLLTLCLMASCHKSPEPMKKPIFQVEVAKPEVRDVDLYKTYIGNVQAFVQVEIKAQVEGVLTSYHFVEGQEVKKDDLLFTIDKRPFVAALSKTKASLAQNIVNLRYAQDVAKRNSSLAKKDYVSQLQYDQYITDVMTAKAAIEENEADIETAEINLSYCEIHSPIDAVTGKLEIQVGNLIENAGQTPLITLNQISPVFTYFSVPQKDLPQIMKLHRQDPLAVNAFLGGDKKTPYLGKLDLIDNQVDNQTGAIWLRAVFPNKTKMLWPGEFVDVHLFLGHKKDAILVPTEAISLGQKGKYVFVIKDDNTSKLRYVKTSQIMGSMTLIEEGLNPGENVVIKGQVNLGKGTKVRIKKQKGKEE